MDKELALRTFGYLIGHYKTHDETIINSQEIEAIEFMLKDNDKLERQVKNQKEVIDKAIKYIDDLRDESAERQGFYNCFPDDLYISDIDELLDILKEVE